jgi:hypothetical protein
MLVPDEYAAAASSDAWRDTQYPYGFRDEVHVGPA